jgi:hypothetical protein
MRAPKFFVLVSLPSKTVLTAAAVRNLIESRTTKKNLLTRVRNKAFPPTRVGGLQAC